MKVDTQSLSQKEVSDAELEAVYGGGLGVGASDSFGSSTRIHSFAGRCDINIFSNNVLEDQLKRILSIANENTQICTNND